VVLVEVARKAYLASLVPVIVNAILNEHQIVADIVAFVNKGDFPRSRLGEKQRGKILASWVTSKMRTMAQFGIRDADGGLSELTETVEPRHSGSLRNSSVIASSLRNVEPAPKILEQRELEQRELEQRELEQRELEQQHETGSLTPNNNAETPVEAYNDSILDSTTLGGDSINRSDDTPTEAKTRHFEPPTGSAAMSLDEGVNLPTISAPVQSYPSSFMNDYKSSDIPPPVGPKPSSMAPQLPELPAAENREGDLWTLPSQQHFGDLKLQHPVGEDGDDWPEEALRHMNLTNR
jgi:hypothetical protein